MTDEETQKQYDALSQWALKQDLINEHNGTGPCALVDLPMQPEEISDVNRIRKMANLMRDTNHDQS